MESIGTLEGNHIMITREAALRRLIGRWIVAVIDYPHVARTIPLKTFLTMVNVEAVQALDLYADYDDWNEARRGREMIRAWLSPQRGATQ
jgi:hypothetical protein